MSHVGRLALPWGAALLAALGSAACGSQCDRHPDEPPTVYDGGKTDQRAHVYMSSLPSGPWLDFPPGRTYRFMHHLGGTPSIWLAYFAFSPNPVPQQENGTGAAAGFAPGAGNQATFQNIGPDFVDLRNDTCSDVFVLVVLAAPVLFGSTDAGTRDASGDSAP